MSAEASRKLQLDTSGSEDEDLKMTQDSHSTSPDTSLDSSRLTAEPRSRSHSAKGSRLLEIEETKPEEEEEDSQKSVKRRGSLPDLKTEYRRRRQLPLGRILSPSHIDGFRKWALGDKFLDDLEVLKLKYEKKRHSSVPLHQVIQEAEESETEIQDVNRRVFLVQDKKEDFGRRRSFTPDLVESIIEESEQSDPKNIVKHDGFLKRLGSDVVDLPDSPRTIKPRMSWVTSSESILEEEEKQDSLLLKHDEFIKRISTYETPMPTKEASVNLIEVCEEEEER